MKVVEIDINKVIPYARNPRKNEKAVPKVAASIKEFGFQQPIVVDKNNVIIVGHTRWEAAKKLGLKKVPIVIADKLTPQQVKAYRIADNKTHEYSDFDYDLLILELEELQKQNYNLNLTGFEDKDLIKLLNLTPTKNTDPDDVPVIDTDEAPKAKLGQLYELGDHKLLCGDSTKPETYDILLGNKKAQLVWTDPPYNVNYTSQVKGTYINNKLIKTERVNTRSIINDNMTDQEFYEFLTGVFTNIYNYLDLGGPFYICCASFTIATFINALQDVGLLYKQLLIWVKQHFTLTRQDYNYIHEPILYGWKPGAAHKWYGNYNNTTVFDYTTPIDKMKKDELLEFTKKLLEIVPIDVFKVDRAAVNELHPTTKPVKLITPMIINSSQQGDIVLEPFAGSGSTLIACEALQRKCYAIELDPHYVDVIIARWENYTGKKAKLVN